MGISSQNHSQEKANIVTAFLYCSALNAEDSELAIPVDQESGTESIIENESSRLTGHIGFLVLLCSVADNSVDSDVAGRLDRRMRPSSFPGKHSINYIALFLK